MSELGPEDVGIGHISSALADGYGIYTRKYAGFDAEGNWRRFGPVVLLDGSYERMALAEGAVRAQRQGGEARRKGSDGD